MTPPREPGAPPAREPGAPDARGTDPVSIAAFVLGLLGISIATIPIGLALGVVGLLRTGPTSRKGRWAAVLGILLSLLWGVLYALLIVLALAYGGDDRELDDGPNWYPRPTVTST